jgi:hypothetical protein
MFDMPASKAGTGLPSRNPSMRERAWRRCPAAAGRGLVTMLVCSALALPALARPDAADDAAPQLSVEIRPNAAGAQAFDAGPREVDYQLWLARGRTAIGLGFGAVLAAHPAPGPNGEPDGAATDAPISGYLTAGWRLSESSWLTLAAAATQRTIPDREVRLGLELRPTRALPSGLAHGTLLRAQLSGSAQLSLRLRKGGLRLVLRSEF